MMATPQEELATRDEMLQGGIPYPKEIWLDQNLKAVEKNLLVEIYCLSRLKKGCIASNEHFAKVLNIGLGSVVRHISKLSNAGYITKLTYDGKNRRLAVNFSALNPRLKNQPAKAAPEPKVKHPKPIQKTKVARPKKNRSVSSDNTQREIRSIKTQVASFVSEQPCYKNYSAGRLLAEQTALKMLWKKADYYGIPEKATIENIYHGINNLLTKLKKDESTT